MKDRSWSFTTRWRNEWGHSAASPSEGNGCNFETICRRRWHLIQKHDINPQICIKIRKGGERMREEKKKSCLFTITGSEKGMKTAETA